MARRCLCARLLAALRDDPRLATLSLSARMLFLLVAEAAARAPEHGILPFADPRRVALLVSCPATEAETGLETLLAEGLIRVEGGGLAVPLLLEAATRSEIARRNGSNGGRPRKGETREQYLARRQGEMLLPIAAPPAEKPTGTEAAEPAREPPTGTGESESPPGGGDDRAREIPAWVSLGIELAELAGMDGARGGFDYRPVQAWLSAGHPPAVIRDAVVRAVGRPSYRPGRAYSLKFFDAAVAQAAAEAKARQAAAPRALTSEERRAEAEAFEAIERRVEAVLLGRQLPRGGERGAA